MPSRRRAPALSPSGAAWPAGGCRTPPLACVGPSPASDRPCYPNSLVSFRGCSPNSNAHDLEVHCHRNFRSSVLRNTQMMMSRMDGKPLDDADRFTICVNAVNEYVNGLSLRPDRAVPPAGKIQFVDLLKKLSINGDIKNLSSEEMSMIHYAIDIVLKEIKGWELPIRTGYYADEIRILKKSLNG